MRCSELMRKEERLSHRLPRDHRVNHHVMQILENQKFNSNYMGRRLQPCQSTQLSKHGKMATLPVNGASAAQLPDEMFRFILQHAAPSESGARLGELTLRQRHRINTPHYVASTSRGAVPHLSPDNLARHTRISAVYLALEDCKDP